MTVDKIIEYIKAAVTLWPSIQLLLDQFVSMPKAEREVLAKDIHEAVLAQVVDGDTSKLAEIIKRGKKS